MDRDRGRLGGGGSLLAWDQIDSTALTALCGLEVVNLTLAHGVKVQIWAG